MNKENLLTKIKLSEDNTIKSIELVEIINEFRKLEKGKAELQHKTFIEKIKKEVKTLETLGLEGQQNFLPSSYINSQNKSQPCFELNRDGMLQMLNSESTLVRYKTIEYINTLENQVKQLESDNKELYEVAISNKEKEKRQYEANKIKYAIKNIEKVLSECNYTNIVAEADKIIEVHRNLYLKDRYIFHQNTDKYGQKGDNLYVNHVKNIIIKKFDKLRPTMTLKDVNISAIMSDKARRLQKEIEVSENISVGMESSKLKTENKDLKNKYEPPFDKFICIEEYPLSKNKLTRAVEDWSTGKPRIVSTDEYNNWKYWFKNKAEKVNLKETFKNIDFSQPVYIHYKVICHENNDTSNFIDALHDVLQEIFNCDDRDFLVGSQERLGHYIDRRDGKVWLYINN